MKQKIFMIFDDKAKAYLPPWFLPEMGMAIRAFSDCCNDPSHAFGRHPADYTLFCAGTWDVLSGRFEIEESYVACANGVELVKAVVLPSAQRDFIGDSAEGVQPIVRALDARKR